MIFAHCSFDISRGKRDFYEKIEMAKTRPILKTIWFQWYDWLINHIPESMKKSKSNTKQVIMRLFESKICNNTPADCKMKKIAYPFEGRDVEYKSGKCKHLSMTRYVIKSRTQ